MATTLAGKLPTTAAIAFAALAVLTTGPTLIEIAERAEPADAGAYYTATFTGYAMGARYGASGAEVSIGHFAGHHPSYCPGDPSSWWPWYTHIRSTYPQGPFAHPGTGGTFYLTDFYLTDTGDPYCTMGNYWVDLYFGRHKRSWESCTCPGVGPGFCYTSAYVNHCNSATNYGIHYNTQYYKY